MFFYHIRILLEKEVNVMSIIFGIGLLMLLVFSFSVACYLVYFKISFGGGTVKAAMTFGIGLLVFALSSATSIVLVWPPNLWSLLWLVAVW